MHFLEWLFSQMQTLLYLNLSESDNGGLMREQSFFIYTSDILENSYL